MGYTFQWRQPLRSLPAMLWGASVSLEIAILAMFLGTVLGLVLLSAKQSRRAWLVFFADTWIELARNTPALYQIYMIYFGLGSLGLRVDSYSALLFGITFNNAGYLAETFRGAFVAVPETQLRSARSLGMGMIGAQWHVVLPQMFRVAFPALTNQMIWSILMTSLGVIVGLATDLTGVTQALNVKSFRTMELFLIAAAIYYVIAKLFTVGARLLAWRLFRY